MSSRRDTPKGKAAEKFKALAEQYTNGAVKVEGTRTARSTRTRKRWRRCSSAPYRCWRPSLAKFGPLGVKEFEVFDLPYIFDGYEALNKVTQGAGGQQLLKARAQGHPWPGLLGQRLQVVLRQHADQKPEDLKGKKMRIQSSKVLESRCARSSRCRR